MAVKVSFSKMRSYFYNVLVNITTVETCLLLVGGKSFLQIATMESENQ